jgi:hypothetical protein
MTEMHIVNQLNKKGVLLMEAKSYWFVYFTFKLANGKKGAANNIIPSNFDYLPLNESTSKLKKSTEKCLGPVDSLLIRNFIQVPKAAHDEHHKCVA